MKTIKGNVQKPNKEQKKNDIKKGSPRLAEGTSEAGISSKYISKRPVQGNELVKLIQQKSATMDDSNEKILIFADGGIIEIDDRIKNALTMTCQNIYNKLLRDTASGDVTAEEVGDILTFFECCKAAFITTDGYIEAKCALFSTLAQMKQSPNQNERQAVNQGLQEFLEKSKANIFYGRRTFEDLPYIMQNSEEKEYLRHIFIAEMCKSKLIDYKYLVDNGIIATMSLDILNDIYKRERILSTEQLGNAYYISGIFKSREELLEYLFKSDKNCFFGFATIEDIAKQILSGKVEPKDVVRALTINNVKRLPVDVLEDLLCVKTFPHNTGFLDFIPTKNGKERYLNTDFLLELPRESFMRIILSEKIKYKNMLVSDDYIDLYGTLNSEDLFLLNQKGKVDSRDLIRLTRYESIRIQNPEEYNNMIEKQMDFYSITRLEQLLNDGELNLKFAENYNNFLENVLTEEQRNEYLNTLKSELEERENSEELIVELSQKGIDVKQLGRKISLEIISDMFIEERISEEEVIELYRIGLLTPEDIAFVFSPEDMITKYENGILDYRILNFIESRSIFIKENLDAGRLTVPQLMDLYSKETGIDINEFLEIVKDYNLDDDNLVDYLSDDISKEKVERLFKNYYISQDDLSILVGRNIISKEEAEDLAKQIATDQEYESIFKDTTGVIVLTQDTEPGEPTTKGIPIPGNGNSRASQLKIDPELQELLLDEINFDSRRPRLQGANNSLDGYTLYPSKKFGVMVFLKPDKAGNATYIMSLQQGLYFLKKIIRDNKTNQVKDVAKVASDATKKVLRETEFVKVKNASAGWGKNIVDSIKSLSPEFREKIKTDKEYNKGIEDVVAEIRDDYIERKRESEEK